MTTFPSITSLTIMMIVASTTTTTSAFVVRPSPKTRASTSLNLDDWVADLVDQEYYRGMHKKEFEKEWMEKNGNLILNSAPASVEGQDTDMSDFRQHAKDKKLAKEDPQRYCADRCVATGNCDVYEDIFELSPEQVLSFCNDCVLAEDKEECDIPEAFYEFGEDDATTTPFGDVRP